MTEIEELKREIENLKLALSLLEYPDLYHLAKAIHEIQETLNELTGFTPINKIHAPTMVGLK